MVELSQAGLQGVEALGEDGGHWRGDGVGGCGGSRRGQGLALRVCLAVGKSRLRSLSWTLHSQEPRNPLQQNQVHLTHKDTNTDKKRCIFSHINTHQVSIKDSLWSLLASIHETSSLNLGITFYPSLNFNHYVTSLFSLVFINLRTLQRFDLHLKTLKIFSPALIKSPGNSAPRLLTRTRRWDNITSITSLLLYTSCLFVLELIKMFTVFFLN